VNPLVFVPLCPFVFVTTTSTVPAACAGVKAVIDVLFTTATLDAAVPPIETLAPDWNPAPVIVMEVPPAVGPEAGDTVLMLGAGVGVGVDPPPHGSTVPTGAQLPSHRHHWLSRPNT
jgi:hypothetical protein